MHQRLLYRGQRGMLVAVDSSNGAVLWRLRPDDKDVLKVLPIPDSDDCIVLLDASDEPGSVANLVRVQSDGKVLWRADPPEPEGNDYWVDASWGGRGRDFFVANSWSCFAAVLSTDAGEIVDKEFTK